MTVEPTVTWWNRLGDERERVVADLASGPDGALYTVGRTAREGGEEAGSYLARYTSDGTRRWQIRLEAVHQPSGVVATSAGPVAAGERYQSVGADEDGTAWLGAFTPEGTERWIRTYREGERDAFEAVVETPDGLVAGGSTGSFAERSADGYEHVFGTTDLLVAVEREDGTERWQETYHGDCCTSIALAGGESGRVTGDDPAELRFVDHSRVVRVAADGTELDSTYYYAENGSFDTLETIAIAADGHSVLAGNAWEGRERNDARLLVADPTSEAVLDVTVGFPAGSSFGRDALPIEGGYLLAGSTLGEGAQVPWLAGIDADGERRWTYVVARDPGGEPRLEPVGEGDLAGHFVAGRHADVVAVVPVRDGGVLAYAERDRSRRPEHRRAWLCRLEW